MTRKSRVLATFPFIVMAVAVWGAADSALTHQKIAREGYMIDLHCDTIYRIHKMGGDTSLLNSKAMEAGIPRLREGGVKAQFFAMWIPPGQGPDYAASLIKLFDDSLSRYPELIAPAASVADLQQNAAQGKISAFLAIEGGDAIATDLELLDLYHKLGVRYMTLTWNHSNAIGDAAADKSKPHNGLSEFGKKVVARMNELGIMVDVSHASEKTAWDALALSRAPVIASHSNCHALRQHPRNLKDDFIKALCAKGGVIGVNYHRTFLTDKSAATVSMVADHIDHLVNTGGVGCVALGSDFDGSIHPPADLAHAGDLPALTEELIKRGYGREQLELIYGGNVMRVLIEVMELSRLSDG